MAMQFKRAHKAQSNLRMAISGLSGTGKTYTSLVIAQELAGENVAVIDSERGSAAKYSDLFTFDSLVLDTFSPEQYIEAIKAAVAGGYHALVIDSLSHAWNGKGGLLEIVEAIAKRSYQGNSFRAWAEATPLQNRLIDAITSAPLHIIATMRAKAQYAVETNERGKATPKKVGIEAVQREGMEYEFDIYGHMTLENELIIEKSRAPELSGQVIRKPGADLAQAIERWLAGDGTTPAPTIAPAAPTPPTPVHELHPAPTKSASPKATPRAQGQAPAVQPPKSASQQFTPEVLTMAKNQEVLSLLRNINIKDTTAQRQKLDEIRVWLGTRGKVFDATQVKAVLAAQFRRLHEQAEDEAIASGDAQGESGWPHDEATVTDISAEVAASLEEMDTGAYTPGN